MHLNVPPDLEALVHKRLATGSFANAEEVIRRALEAQDAEETWSEEELPSLDAKIGRALKQVEAGNIYGPEEARLKLNSLRNAHLLSRD